MGLISRSQERCDAAAKTITDKGGVAMGVEADVRDYDSLVASMEKVKDAYGEFDVLISGAAGNFLQSAVGLSANAFKTVVDIDLLGTFNAFRASWDFIRKPGASLIAITAGLADNPTIYQTHACAAKAGVNALTRNLALEWGPAGVRVNGIAPGPIKDTEGMARLAPTPEATKAMMDKVALRDYGYKQDIGDLSVFLSSRNGRYITGTIIECDGGLGLGDGSGDALKPLGRG